MSVSIANLGTPLITTSWNGSSFDHTVSITIGSGSDVLSVRMCGGATATFITIDGNSLTQRASLKDGNTYRIQIHDIDSPPIGTFDLIINTGGGGATYNISIDTISGVDSTTPRGTIVTSSGYGSNKSVDASTSSGDLVIDAWGASSSSVSASNVVGSGQTVDFIDQNKGAASHEIATTTTTTMSWTHDAGYSVLAAIPYIASSGGATGIPVFRRRIEGY